MSDWPNAALGELMLRRGGSLLPSEFPSEEFELYSIPAHDRGGYDIVVGRDVGSSKQVVQPRDVMISKIVPHIRRSRVVAELNGRRQIASGEWIVFRSNWVDPDYLRHYLASDTFHRQFMGTVAGVGGSLLRARPAAVSNLPVPLPPIEEQRRIAAILDHAAKLVVDRRRSLEALRLAGDAVIGRTLASVTDLQQIPLGHVAEIRIGPFGSLLHREDYVADGVPLINPMHIVDGRIAPDAGYLVSKEKMAMLRRYHLRRGDVVMGRRGEMGRCAVVSEVEDGYLCGTGSLIIRPKLDRARTAFLQKILSHKSTVRALEARALGVTMLNLNTKILETLPIPQVDLMRQDQVIDGLAALEARRDQMEMSLDFLVELASSLQARAFSGRL